jgi:AcrR family transcriptional regulator
MSGTTTDKRDTHLIEAAIRKFLRYGMGRTTMSDIAREAGVSRQTLYASFASKEDLLRATIRYLADRNVGDIRRDCAKTQDPGKQLDAVILHTAIRSYELLHASPDADDMVTGFDAACKEELAEAAARYRELIAVILQPYELAIRSRGMSVAQLADFIQRSTLTLKHEATTPAHLDELANALKVLVLTLLDVKPAPADIVDRS